MKTWNDYKEHVRTVDPEIGKDIDEVENISFIVSAMVEQRTSLGLSQREIAILHEKSGNETIFITAKMKCSLGESNPQLPLRRGPLYPFN